MTGRLKDLSFGRNGEQIITLAVKADFTEQFDELKDFDVDIEIKKHRKMRSNEANKYCWVLCEKIAQRLSDEGVKHTKLDVYRDAIKEVGVWKDVELDPDAAETLSVAWAALGSGWLTEQTDYSKDGESVIVRFYYGSSRYNSKQMSRLIDNLVQDCQELGIETDTPEQIAKIKALWAEEEARVKAKEKRNEQK
ncbi:MAG: hypothetical protein IKJ04_07215 [Clostridia bacterium]|nr:hypothetical protein [Clostridia bacterium]